MPDYVSTEGRAFVAASGRIRISGNEVEATAMQPPAVERAVEQGYAVGDALPRVLIPGPVSYSTLKITVRLKPAQAWLTAQGAWLNAVLDGTVTYSENVLGVAAVDVTGMLITKLEISNAEGATAGEITCNIEAQPRRVALDKNLGV